jgi:2-dehydropantoate 2-reductase
MSYVIYGAGAIGATIGARLHLAGHDVTLVARGAHLERLQADGLVLHEPTGTSVLAIPAVGEPSAIAWRDDTVVVLATKSQDTPAAASALAVAAPPSVPVVCAQNGLSNEPTVLRHLPCVYGAHVVVSADHLEPGVVARFGVPVVGLVDLGRFPVRAGASAGDPTGSAIVADLDAAGFRSRLDDDIMAAKARKLHFNLGNAVAALIPAGEVAETILAEARAEADRVFAAAGVAMVTEEADRRRREGMRSAPAAGDGVTRAGGSTTQSLLRRTGSIETDHLNGEIVLLGRLHDVSTPVNEVLQRQAALAAWRREPPAAMAPGTLAGLIDARRREVGR